MKISEAIHYDPDTGIFTWKTERHRKLKNKTAGHVRKTGHRVILFNGVTYHAGRLAWLLYFGAVPDGVLIDHVNRIPDDNRICNLRLATRNQNAANCLKETRGVYWTGNSWRAQLKINGITKYLGSFRTQEEALTIVREAHVAAHGAFSPCA